MNLAKKIASTIAIQAVGPLTLFFVVWLIGSTVGPESQGKFSALKSFVDLLVAFLSFGLPQSFIYGINQLGVRREALFRWTLRYGVAISVLVLFSLIGASTFYPAEVQAYLPIHVHQLASVFLMLGLSVSISGLVVAALMRGIFLTISDGPLFSVLTVQPVLWLCATVATLVCLGNFSAVLAYSISGALSALVGVSAVKGHLKLDEMLQKSVLPLKRLFGNGAAVFMQAMGAGLQPFLTFMIVRQHGGSFHDIAFFSVAMYVYQAGAMPLTMAAPILYNRWSHKGQGSPIARDLIRLLILFLPLLFLVALGRTLVPLVVPLVFKEGYSGAVPAIQTLMLGVPLLYIVYVGAPALMSIGRFKVNTLIFIARLAICVVGLAFFLDSPSINMAEQAAKSWVSAELFAAATVLALLIFHFFRKPRRESIQ